MKRRDWLQGAGVAALATGLAACGKGADPGAAGDTAAEPVRQWKMVTAWPANFPGLGTGAARLAELITQASGGRITVKVFGGGELVPPFEVFDAVSRGTAEMGHDAAYYHIGKAPAAGFYTAVPFGMTAQELALRHPQRVEKLVLVGTYARPDPKRRLLLQKWREMAKHDLGADVMVRERLLWTLSDETLAQRDLIDAMASSFPGGGLPVGRDVFIRQCDACLGHDTMDRLRAISQPTLVICGRHDQLTPPKFHRELADAQRVTHGVRVSRVNRRRKRAYRREELVLQLLRHVVEGAAQDPDLVQPADARAHGEVALTNGARRPHEALDRDGDAARDEPPEDQRHGHAQREQHRHLLARGLLRVEDERRGQADGIRRDRLASADLARYERGWRRRLGSEIRIALAFRRLAERLDDAAINSLIHLARVNGVVPLLQETASFNWHRKAVVSLLGHAAFRRIVLRSICA